MRFNGIILALAGLACVLPAGPAGAQFQSQMRDDHPCAIVIDCDCNSISAGILTRGMRNDCRSCQRDLIDACKARYERQLLSQAMVAGGYCSRTCSVAGDGPSPLPPENGMMASSALGASPSLNAQEHSRQEHGGQELGGLVKLRCADGESWLVETEGSTKTAGCIAKNGSRTGLWVLKELESGAVTEILYEGGKETWRREQPVSE